MLSTLRMDFVDTARIKGISRSTVLMRHVVRNAIVSIVVVFGVNLAFLISGTVIVENVFSIPGLGQLLVDSVSSRDYPVVQGTTLVLRVPRRPRQPDHRCRPRRARSAGDVRVSTALRHVGDAARVARAAVPQGIPAGAGTAHPRHRPPGAGNHDPGLAWRHRSSRATSRTPSTRSTRCLRPLSPGHLLGTDSFGRDILSRILYGGRIDLLIAFGATSVTAGRRHRDRAHRPATSAAGSTRSSCGSSTSSSRSRSSCS